MKGQDPRQLHQQIAADLRAAIMSGDLPPDSKLPSTAELMELFDAKGNRTVQTAITTLKDEGYLIGRSGKGVFVRERLPQVIVASAYLTPASVGEPYGGITEAATRGHAWSFDLLDVAEVDFPNEVATVLVGTRETGKHGVRRSLLSRLDGEPAELVDSYYPLDLARGTALAERRKIRGGSPRVFADLGLIPVRAVDHVSARPPTPAEFERLELPAEVPVLRTFRVVYTAERAIEATVMVKAGHLYTLEYQL